MNLRIGLTGASCTGKTTLAKEISKQFNLEIIMEIARELFSEFNISSPRELETLSDEIRYQNRILDVKSGLERRSDSFVADRTYVDAAAYWLYHLSTRTSDEQSYSYLEKCKELMNNYHIVIFLAYDRLGRCLVDDGVRSNKLSYNYSLHLLMKGMLEDWDVPYFQLTGDNNHQVFEYIEKKMVDVRI